MPFIDDEKLAELYREADQEKKSSVYFQNRYFASKLKLSLFKVYKYGFFCLSFVLLVLACHAWFFSTNATIKEYVSREQELLNKIDLLEKESVVNIQKALENQTVYSVQFITSEREGIRLFSKNFVNFRAHHMDDLNAYSLGNFATEEEAEAFKQELMEMGLTDLWITSFKQGKRVLLNDE